MSVSPHQRHTRARRCPICDGADGDPRGQGKRCNGFTSDDSEWVHCSREEIAGGLPQEDGGTYAHRMRGPCKCGTVHNPDNRIRDEIEATYQYTDETGSLLYEVVRKTGKRFLQRKPDGAGGWEWKLNGVRRVPYRFRELIEDDGERPVYVVEGEKDADALSKRGHTATCNPGGAGKWHTIADVAKTALQGRDVVVVADNDDVGRKHGRDVATSLAGIARSVRLLRCPSHKDVSDHLAAGGTLEQLVELSPAEATEPPDGSTVAPCTVVRCLTADEFFADESQASLVVPYLGICAGPPLGLVGRSYAGKTITALAMGMSVALGRDLWGAWRVQQGPWVHLDYEQGRRHTKARIRRLAWGFGVQDDELRALIEAGAIRIAVHPALNLTTVGAADHYARVFEDARLVTCDSLRVMLGGVDENSSQVRGLMSALSIASDRSGAAVGLIHHGGKTPLDGERERKEIPRGSSGIVDEFQSLLVMSKKKGDPVALVSHEKDRELGDTVADFGLRIEDVPQAQDPKWGLRVVHVDREEMAAGGSGEGAKLRFERVKAAVMECVRDNPGIAGAEAVVQTMGGTAKPIRDAVKVLMVDEKLVERKARGGKGKGRRLFLAHCAPVEEG